MTATTSDAVSTSADRPYDEVDLSSRAFWSATPQEREESFAILRKRPEITWHRPFEDQLLPDESDHGFWAITTYDDLVEVTRRHEDFLSGPGILMDNLPQQLVEAAVSIIGMDPPRHTAMRRLVSAAFTPKQMRRIEDQIKANARLVVDNLFQKAAESEDGIVDFVSECATLVPMHNINDFMGVPMESRQHSANGVQVGTSWNDPEVVGSADKGDIMARLFKTMSKAHSLASGLAAERRVTPGDDLITALALAEVDGERLTDFEIGSFFVLLSIAGTDTTRQSIALGLKTLTDNPDQRAWLMEDLEGRINAAAEEIVRVATPIMTFRRTAARDLEFRGRQILKGDKVVMFYQSANWDETRIENPDQVILSRHPNPHITFGGGGIHHCLGNQLARFQIRALYTELLTRAPKVESIGDPVRSPSNFLNQVKRLDCRLNLDS